ncbi:uncharacterized protein LOC111303906 isoform X2 [Durio zibethinus]|nr:uncharacterized protein LOC111303906 isoform X2 [Durio zibethinus]XP_022756150.1 uncharacterized protein LOC111303906 isoform X2 [Durio zibethinus]XP_022756151.1 uncharacterized protein LOC111303906 isoform X2 [Durio zibethinus]XP_022756152.1 uncharacterized protein LOC111303906 isoform X2 [Durio zibethinus]
MSPASKSKSKDKKAGKESQKASSKPSGSANVGSGVPASAYNPLLGTFHTIETVPLSSASPLHDNGRFRNIDETDEHLGGPLGAGVEYDSVSNNGSWSGESEDHKDKTSNPPIRQEIIPGADNDKREKIRQKNERKHQRQKERRAQELHERCSGYLMSRKLEALAQQLVAMGFSHDRATMALILNEGKLEKSVAWLFEGGEEAVKHKESTIGGGNLKIDISEELARFADMEIRYKSTKQEVERAVVAAEGDLEKAAEALRTLKQDPPAPPKHEETCDPVTTSTNRVSVAGSQYLSFKTQPKANLSPATQQRRDEKDFNYTKAAVAMGGSSESVSKSFRPLKRIQPKLDWAKPQQSEVPAEKRWPSSGSNPSVSYSMALPLQASPSPANTESHYVAVGSDFKNLQPSIREPVIMMQRPQSINTKHVPATSTSTSPPGTTSFMYPTSIVEITKSNGFMPHIPSARSLSSNNMSSNQMHHHHYYAQGQQQQHLTSGSGPGDSPGTSRGNGLWSRTGTSTLAAASSLGLFTGLGSTTSSGASSPVDWSSGSSMAQLDYANIDWSLDRGLYSSPMPGGIWMGPESSVKSAHMSYPNRNGLSVKPAMRLTPTNGNGVPIVGFQDGGVASAEAPTAGSREWTSPFEGKDLFSLPGQFVSSPSL